MKGIKSKLTLVFGVMFAITCSILSIAAYTNATKVLMANTQESITEVAIQTSKTITGLIDGNLKQLESIAAREDLISSNVSKEEKIQILKQEAERIGCERLTIIDLNGDSFNGNGKEQYLGDREYYIKAIAGESNVTDPTIGKSTGQLLVFYAVPIKDGDKIIGVLQEVQDGTNLSLLTNQVTYGKNGFAYMIKDDGTIIAHPNDEIVLNCENIITAAEEDSNYIDYAKTVSLSLENKLGSTSYKKDGSEKYVGYAQVEGTTWEILVQIDKDEILSGLSRLEFLIYSTSTLFIILGIGVAYLIANNIAKGINESSSKLETLSKGDLRIEVNEKYINLKNEIGEMSRAMKVMADSFSKTVIRIKTNSTNIDEQSETLSHTADEITQVSQNVADTIGEVARGTNEQTENLTKISFVLNELGSMVHQIVEEIRDVNDTSKVINEHALNSSEEMKQLNSSVEKVENTFSSFQKKINDLGDNVNEISQISNAITEIADQTNLLALNAAIEAARAGETGKGFAVVAEEIRALAEQSQNSSEKISKLVSNIAKETQHIVEESTVMDSELNQQGDVIKKSIDSFHAIISAIEEVLPKINTAEKSADALNDKKDVILENVDNISSVAQEVSASAQEISAAAEEMNASIADMAGIAEKLKHNTAEMRESVDEFKTKE